ncbi:MAG TPA: hydantoinase/oxoprolinase family protein [Gaiellaceae bacterium]|nr:hydantoinase/oxoprolinase family protein [Gaiellaceae bacterium]
MAIRVGIDTGGTFTDLVAVDEAGRSFLAKVPSNPDDPVQPIAAALREAGIDPVEVELVVVGTTIGINAVLTRRGARVLYLTTKGFEDIPYIQRINRKHHYDFRWRKPTPLVRRRDCVGVVERLDEEGRVLTPLDADALAAELDRLCADGRAGDDGELAIAVCLLFSYLNPEHELAVRDAIRARHPHLPVSLSHEVAPIWREYERGTTVTVDAFTKPLFERYVDAVSQALGDAGVGRRWALLKSNGGRALAAEARRRPAHLLLSGIAGGGIGGAHAARAAGAAQAIALDMGGTSCDVCLVVDGEPLYSADFELEFGFPVSVPGVSTRTIGAGGGSIGWVDPGGFLQVGPQSAGASPGPACYGQGGELATITDANLVLARLDPAFFLGGRMALDRELARAALARLGAQLGLDEVEVASAMVRVCNENMANAIRILTVEQGSDPREQVLVAFGGAGPTHACEIAEALGMRRVLVPPAPGLYSAFGALASSVRIDAVRSVHLTDVRTSAAEVAAVLDELEQQARGDFAAQSSAAEEPEIRRLAAMRYQGQNYEQEVPFPPGPLDDAALEAVYAEYGRLYESFYGYRLDGIPIELVRLAVIAAAAAPVFARQPGVPELVERPHERRNVFFPEVGFVATGIVRRDGLVGGDRLEGPAVVEFADSTAVVPPGWTLSTRDDGILEVTR